MVDSDTMMRPTTPSEHGVSENSIGDDVIVSMRGIERSYRSGDGKTVDILKGADLNIHRGSLTVIRGTSGSGKTTLLRILGMLDSDFGGTYRLAGNRVDGAPEWHLDELRADKIGFIFQEGRLFEHLSLRRNIEIPLQLQGFPDDQVQNRVAALEAEFFASESNDRNVIDNGAANVSGGQKQRAAIMRAMATNPAIILADEPTASLHGEMKEAVVEMLHDLSDSGQTVIIVSHDDVFYEKGRQLKLLDGSLVDVQTSDLAATRPFSVQQDGHVDVGLSAKENFDAADRDAEGQRREKGKKLLWGWRPRAPFTVLLQQAWHEVFSRKIFLGLILSALVIGICQVAVFSSVIIGAEQFIDQRMTEGSRLNRVEIKPRLRDRSKEDRFPVRTDVSGWETVDSVVARRTALALVTSASGEDVTYTAMGLHKNDPEYSLLDFIAGGPFSAIDEPEVIVTLGLLSEVYPDLASASGTAGADGKSSLDSAIGQPLLIKLNQYNRRGKVVGQTPVPLKIVGVILNGEAGRQLYLPNGTNLAFDQFKKDRTGTRTIAVDPATYAWVDKAAVMEGTDFPWEDALHVYTREIAGVLPVYRDLSRNGYKPSSDIWKFKWALDIQDTAWRVFVPLLLLIVASVSLTVFANIFISAKLRERELALWRVLGMRRGDLVLTQMISTFLSVAVGTAMGLLIGGGLVSATRDMLRVRAAETAEASGLEAQNFDAVFAPVGDFAWIILPIAILVGLLAALYPSIRTARTDPAKVLQS